MRIYGLTDKGLVRDINEDSIGISCFPGGPAIALVCDGVGGAAGGKTASEIAVNVFSETIIPELYPLTLDSETPPPLDTKKIKRALRASIAKANEVVFAVAREHDELRGMGSTVNAVVYSKELNRLCFANVGDSRLYMINEKEIKQLSKDHSYVQYLVDMGQITPEEAKVHPKRNLITRAVGIDLTVDPDISHIKTPSRAHTFFLLCSDGLYGLVSEERIQKIVLSNREIEDKVITLISAANREGGLDNISALLLEINEEGEAEK